MYTNTHICINVCIYNINRRTWAGSVDSFCSFDDAVTPDSDIERKRKKRDSVSESHRENREERLGRLCRGREQKIDARMLKSSAVRIIGL